MSRLLDLSRLPSARTIALITLSVPAVLLAKHAFNVYREVTPIKRKRIIEVDSIPDSLESSESLKHHVNPLGNVGLRDSRYLDITLPLASRISDEAILSRFIQGFFGGKVFEIERSLLQMIKPEVVSYKGKSACLQTQHRLKPDLPLTPSSTRIWSTDQLDLNLPPPGSLLVGGFLVAAVELSGAETGESYIDIIFGSNHAGAGFAGIHRFSVIHLESELESDPKSSQERVVRLHYGHLSCNPSVNKPLKPDFLQVLHKIYAMLLFREGAARVVRMVSC
jgi:hypothetical protein